MASTPTLLFIYGTLKRGHRRHDLMAPARCLGRAVSFPGHTLVDCGGYPGLVPAAPDSPGIDGELYAAPAALLETLDAYEAIDTGEYTRAPVDVRDESGAIHTAETYHFARPHHDFPVVGPLWTTAMESPFHRPFP